MSDQLKYHKYILKSSPYGQLPKVLSNLKTLSNLDSESEDIQQVLQEYNEEHLSLVDLKQNGRYFVMSSQAQGQGYYVDQYRKQKIFVNHLTQEIEKIEGDQSVAADLPEPVLQLLDILSKKIDAYVQKYFKETSGSQVFMEITEEGSLNVFVMFTAKNVQLNNFYTGEWLEVWKINKEKIQGSVKIRSHVFESGNVQMNQNKNFERQFEFAADMEENANKILKIIESFDSEIQKSMDQVYEEMSTGFFKNLRRIVPVTKTKMVWNVNSLKMNQNLLKAQKK